jgi:hypothetical protein
MGPTKLDTIRFSERVMAEWRNPKMFEELLIGKRFVNPDEI